MIFHVLETLKKEMLHGIMKKIFLKSEVET